VRLRNRENIPVVYVGRVLVQIQLNLQASKILACKFNYTQSIYCCLQCIWGGDVGVKGVGFFMLDMADNLELVYNFCYLWEIFGKGSGGPEDASRTRVRSAWGKFNKLALI